MRFSASKHPINQWAQHFQFSLWDSDGFRCFHIRHRQGLSILFMRFARSRLASGWIWMRLSILFMRFSLHVLDRHNGASHFQFSLWDSCGVWRWSWAEVEQLSILFMRFAAGRWLIDGMDSAGLSILFMRFNSKRGGGTVQGNKAFNSLYEILRNSVLAYLHTQSSFNSLYEIPIAKIKSIFIGLLAFNSLYEIHCPEHY